MLSGIPLQHSFDPKAQSFSTRKQKDINLPERNNASPNTVPKTLSSLCRNTNAVQSSKKDNKGDEWKIECIVYGDGKCGNAKTLTEAKWYGLVSVHGGSESCWSIDISSVHISRIAKYPGRSFNFPTKQISGNVVDYPRQCTVAMPRIDTRSATAGVARLALEAIMKYCKKYPVWCTGPLGALFYLLTQGSYSRNHSYMCVVCRVVRRLGTTAGRHSTYIFPDPHPRSINTTNSGVFVNLVGFQLSLLQILLGSQVLSYGSSPVVLLQLRGFLG